MEDTERFHPSSGRFAGIVGIVMSVLVAAYGAVDRDAGFPLWVFAGCALVGSLAWTMLLRPDVRRSGEHLVLRQPFSTLWLPLVDIEHVAVERVLMVKVNGRRWISPAIGKSRSDIVMQQRRKAGWRGASADPTPSPTPTMPAYPEFVQERIQHLAADARRRAASARRSSGAGAAEVTRRWAWPEIAATTVSAVALVVTVLL